MKFRKKPLVIEAVQWLGHNFCEIDEFVAVSHETYFSARSSLGVMVIPTLGGEMTAQIGDWIIRGVKGEFYPCKQDIFWTTYEMAL